MTNPTATATATTPSAADAATNVEQKKRKRSTSTSTKSNSNQKRTTNSSTPSKSASIDGGRSKLQQRIRSVLYDPLAIPLVCAFNDTNLMIDNMKGFKENMKGLVGKDCFDKLTTPRKEGYEKILQAAVREWWDSSKKQNKETKTAERRLTAAITSNINGFRVDKSQEEKLLTATNEVKLLENQARRGVIDIIVTIPATGTPATGTPPTGTPATGTPYLVVEVGLSGADWWRKLDQGVKYLDLMRQESIDGPKFTKKLLLAILTIDDDGTKDEQNGKFVMRLGVFLCVPREGDPSCRMCLLWKSQTTTLEGGAKAFGKLLRITKQFQTYRDNTAGNIYKYYSSHCCKIGNYVSWFVWVWVWVWVGCDVLLLCC